MNRPCLNNHSISIPSLLLLALSLISPGLAAEVPLRAFTASYDLYKGGMHVATAELGLQRVDESWRWHMKTEARGIYALFISKKPYSETTFILANNEFQIQQIVITDKKDKKVYESATFDWEKGNMEVLRKGKRKQLPLSAGVYDYHGIHYLAARMGRQQLDSATIDFYRKGKLVKSRFVYSGEGKVNINGEAIGARIYEQVTVKSNSKIKYYYDAENPLLPLRIENLKSGESMTVMTLRKVDWTL